MKKIIIVFVIFLFKYIPAIQAQENTGFLPTLDSLLSLSWKVEGTSYCSFPLINDGFVFTSLNNDYAIKVESGEKLYFTRKEDQRQIKKECSDSLLFSKTNKGISVLNIYNGGKVFHSMYPMRPNWICETKFLRDSLLFSSISDSIFFAFNLLNHVEIWKKSFKSKLFNTPIIYDNIIYITDQSFLYALNKESGEELWKFELGGPLLSKPYLIENIFYAWVKDKGLIALDIEKEEIKWLIGNLKQFNEYEILIEDNIIYLQSGKLYAISLENGEIIWANDIFSSFLSLYIGKSKKYLFAYKSLDDNIILTAVDKKTGEIKYEGFQGYSLNLRPLSHLEHVLFRFSDKMHNNLLIAVDVRKNIYCFEVNEDY
jgi:hypothetical protein